jgi:sulfur carrier protein
VYTAPDTTRAAGRRRNDVNPRSGMHNGNDAIEISVNGKPYRLPDGLTVAQLLARMELHPRLVVVEHNRVILDRALYESAEVRAGDNIELVHFVGGG